MGQGGKILQYKDIRPDRKADGISRGPNTTANGCKNMSLTRASAVDTTTHELLLHQDSTFLFWIRSCQRVKPTW